MSVQRTYLGQYLQNCMYLKRPFRLNKLTTLNTKHEIYADLDLPPDIMPSPLYFSIGDGGHKAVIKSGGKSTFRRLPHRSRHVAMYNQLPFILREINNDLISTERAKYALRKRVTIDGVDYFAYYLKRLDLTAVEPVTMYDVTENGVTTSKVFVPSNADLNPEPPEFVADGTNITRAEEIYTESLVTINFSQLDRDEFMDVVRILYKDEDISIISEMAICSAFDRQVTGDNGSGGEVSYMEAIGVQINHHIQVFRSMKEDDQGFVVKINIGASDPMLVEE